MKVVWFKGIPLKEWVETIVAWLINYILFGWQALVYMIIYQEWDLLVCWPLCYLREYGRVDFFPLIGFIWPRDEAAKPLPWWAGFASEGSLVVAAWALAAVVPSLVFLAHFALVNLVVNKLWSVISWRSSLHPKWLPWGMHPGVGSDSAKALARLLLLCLMFPTQAHISVLGPLGRILFSNL